MRFRPLGLFLVLAVVLSGWAWTQAGRFVSSPADSPTKAELIVALGGDAGARAHGAQALFATGYAPRILLTGINNSDPVTRPAYLGWQAIFLKEHGVPEAAILYDTRSANTWEEARNTRALMEREGWRRVLVVSDPPHMRRLAWVWGKVFAGSGLEVRLVPAEMPGWDAQYWWKSEKSVQFVLMELIKLGYYALHY